MEQLEAQLDKLAEGDILILAGSIPSSQMCIRDSARTERMQKGRHNIG